MQEGVHDMASFFWGILLLFFSFWPRAPPRGAGGGRGQGHSRKSERGDFAPVLPHLLCVFIPPKYFLWEIVPQTPYRVGIWAGGPVGVPAGEKVYHV